MSELEQDHRLIFMTYARADEDRFSSYYSPLKNCSYHVWMDIHDIKAGQDWDFEVRKALDQATLVIAFVSKNSINKRGYLQKELRRAVEKHKEKLVDDIFLIPVILDESEIPPLLRRFQAVFEKEDKCLERIKSSILTQFARLDNAVIKLQERHNLSWSCVRHRDAWEGLPGYDASYELVRVRSENSHAEEIAYLIRGFLTRDLLKEREVMFKQDTSTFNFGKSKYWRTNTYDANRETAFEGAQAPRRGPSPSAKRSEHSSKVGGGAI